MILEKDDVKRWSVRFSRARKLHWESEDQQPRCRPERDIDYDSDPVTRQVRVVVEEAVAKCSSCCEDLPPGVPGVLRGSSCSIHVD